MTGQSKGRIAFQGELGAYSHQACAQARPGYEAVPCQTFEDVVEMTRSGEVVSARLAARRDLAAWLGEGYAWRAAAYSGFRPATLNELHRPFRVGNDITEANAALTAFLAKALGVQIGFNAHDGD